MGIQMAHTQSLHRWIAEYFIGTITLESSTHYFILHIRGICMEFRRIHYRVIRFPTKDSLLSQQYQNHPERDTF